MIDTAASRLGGWQDIFRSARERLGNESEARWIVEEVSGHSWSELASGAAGQRRDAVSPRSRDRVEALVQRRLAREPIQYVLGHWQFRSLDLMVDSRALIPRPETEQVVEHALRELDSLRQTNARPGGRPHDRQLVVDLGTGSGAIALSIAAERPNAHVYASDASRAALSVASANLAGLGGRAATRVTLVEGPWWNALPANVHGAVDMVVSNPPYIASHEMPTLDESVREWEPRDALEAGPTGLEAIDEILAGAAGGWLRASGVAVIEIAPHQANQALRSAADAGFAEAVIRRDLAGRDRVLIARAAP